MTRPANNKGIARNAVLSALSWFFPIVLSFISTPLILRGLGAEIYGLYAVILGFIGYSFSFGVGKAAAKFVAEFKAEGDEAKVREALSATLGLSVAFGALGLVVVFCFARVIVTDLLLIPAALADSAVSSLYVSGTVIFVSMISQVFAFTLQGTHRFDRYAVATSVGSVILNAGSIALAVSGYGLLPIVIWNLVSTVVTCGLYFSLTRDAIPGGWLVLKVRNNIARLVVNYGFAIVLSQVFGNILLLFERGWIARVFGIEALTFYVVPMTLALFLHAFIGSLSIALFPVMNELLANVEKLRLIYHSASATLSWQLAESYGKARFNTVFSLFWLIVGAGLMAALGTRYGIEGVAAARNLRSVRISCS